MFDDHSALGVEMFAVYSCPAYGTNDSVVSSNSQDVALDYNMPLYTTITSSTGNADTDEQASS